MNNEGEWLGPRLLRLMPSYYRKYYASNPYELKLLARGFLSNTRTAAKTLVLIFAFRYLDEHCFRLGNLSLRTPQFISRINLSHMTTPLIEIPYFYGDQDEYEVYEEYQKRFKETSRVNIAKLFLKYQDNPQLESGRLVDEFLFDSDYQRVRDLSRFNAMRQMTAVGFKDVKNESDRNQRQKQFDSLNSRVKPCLD